MDYLSPGSSRMGRHAFSTVASGSFGVVTSALLDAIVIALFGMGWQTDAYFIASTIPLVIITILMLQTTRVVQPLFISKRQTGGDAAGWDYINLMMTNGTFIVLVLCGAGAALSPLLIRAQAIGSPHGAVWLSTQLSVLIFLLLPLYFPIAVMRVVLQSFGKFALPGAMKFFENAFKIAFVLLLGRKLGVRALVLGMFAGALCQISSFYFVLRRMGFRFRPIFRLRHADMTQSYSLMVFPLVGQMCAAGVEAVNNTLSSMLGAGNVTALRLAYRIIDSLAGLLAASIVIAALPTVASSVASGDRGATKKHLQYALYLLLLVTVPLSVWLALMNKPLVSLLYERAKFSAADTTLVSSLLLMMIPYIFLSRFLGLMELPFFGEQNTRTPLMGSLLQAVSFVLFSLLLVRSFGIYALPLGRSVSYLMGSCFLAFLLRRRLGNLGFGSLRAAIGKILLASLIMAAFIAGADKLVSAQLWHGFTAKLLALGLPSSAGCLALVISLFSLRVLDPSMLTRAKSFLARRQRACPPPPEIARIFNEAE